MSISRLSRNLRLDTIIPPVRFRLDGCIVTIYEVLQSRIRSGDSWYHVVLDIEYMGRKTHRFSLDVRSTKDFLRRLMVEISKLKWITLLGEGV